MSWTTVCAMPLLRYDANTDLTPDTSGYGNHGRLVGSPQAHPGQVTFDSVDDQIVVPVRDESLTRFTAVKVSVQVRPHAADRRLNIVEGRLSFAFFLHADASLHGTIYDGTRWPGVSSPPGTVTLGRFSRVTFDYDGISLGRLFCDGRLVGSSASMPLGMRQPVDNITVGHWPSSDGRYTFVGDIGPVQIQRRSPEDMNRDTWALLLCGRALSATQAAALEELSRVMSSLDSGTIQSILECQTTGARLLMGLIRSFRAGDKQVIAEQRKMITRFRAAWCAGEPREAARIVQSYLSQLAGPRGTPGHERVVGQLREALDAIRSCRRTGDPYDRVQELMNILVPGLRVFEAEIERFVRTL